MTKGKIYLIPNTLGGSSFEKVCPSHNSEIINSLSEFIVEDAKSARAFLKIAGYKTSFDKTLFHLLNEHTEKNNIFQFLKSIEEGKSIGLLSDAGCPAVADPGAAIVKLAHEKNIQVVPLVGANSVLLALMASGMNGQSFCFHGYLPKGRNDRVKKLKELEKTVEEKNQTQIFIETPYRNNHMIDDLLNTLPASTLLCIACDITLPTEFIFTKNISEWKKEKPDINKRPAVFLIGK